jgi:2-polyprenyl-6-methoxyphenol hydroxylase-like FAD-dependent oxidoreductase
LASEVVKTTCVVVGGGPAGMMLGYLLARSGIQVAVLEKHNDSSGIFAATPCIHPPSNCFMNWGSFEIS